MYYCSNVIVDKNSDLYKYCDKSTALANNISNATLYLQRQVLFSVNKDPKNYTTNEKQVMDDIKRVLPLMGSDFKMPTKENWFLPYRFVDAFLKVTKNPDYYAEGLSVQSCQQMIKQEVREMKSFCAATREYNKDPSKFTGKPKLPGYKKSGGHCTLILTNQDCKLVGNYLHFPKTDVTCKFNDMPGRLKEVRIKPFYDTYKILAITDDGVNVPSPNEIQNEL